MELVCGLEEFISHIMVGVKMTSIYSFDGALESLTNEVKKLHESFGYTHHLFVQPEYRKHMYIVAVWGDNSNTELFSVRWKATKDGRVTSVETNIANKEMTLKDYWAERMAVVAEKDAQVKKERTETEELANKFIETFQVKNAEEYATLIHRLANCWNITKYFGEEES